IHISVHNKIIQNFTDYILCAYSSTNANDHNNIYRMNYFLLKVI
ncbi:uncharacterized protein METZ01_LOCUS469295, partial [marine metagenome]